jgi:hypothetical protein
MIDRVISDLPLPTYIAFEAMSSGRWAWTGVSLHLLALGACVPPDTMKHGLIKKGN